MHSVEEDFWADLGDDGGRLFDTHSYERRNAMSTAGELIAIKTFKDKVLVNVGAGGDSFKVIVSVACLSLGPSTYLVKSRT